MESGSPLLRCSVLIGPLHINVQSVDIGVQKFSPDFLSVSRVKTTNLKGN